MLKLRTVWFRRLSPDRIQARPIGRPSAIMSPLRKCHSADRNLDCSVLGTILLPPRPRRPRPPIRITSRQTPMSRHPLTLSRSGHPIIGAGKSDPSSKVTSNFSDQAYGARVSLAGSRSCGYSSTDQGGRKRRGAIHPSQHATPGKPRSPADMAVRCESFAIWASQARHIWGSECSP